MLNSKEIQFIRETICSLLAGLNIPYCIPEFDDELYQECIDEARRRGYPIEALKKYLRDSVNYSAITSPRRHRPMRVWLAHYIAICYHVDDVPSRFPAELSSIRLFNNRFTKGKRQGNAVLGALADIIHRASGLFHPVLSNIVVTSTLNFVTGTVLEYETKSMQISSAAEHYPIYQRALTGFTEPFIFMIFPREIPFTAYIQAIPELTNYINDVNDVLSFYKEELAGENTNQISNLATRSGQSKLETLKHVAETVIDHYDKTLKILKGSPKACDAFRHYAVAYFYFHFAAKRYRLAELDL